MLDDERSIVLQVAAKVDSDNGFIGQATLEPHANFDRLPNSCLTVFFSIEWVLFYNDSSYRRVFPVESH